MAIQALDLDAAFKSPKEPGIEHTFLLSPIAYASELFAQKDMSHQEVYQTQINFLTLPKNWLQEIWHGGKLILFLQGSLALIMGLALYGIARLYSSSSLDSTFYFVLSVSMLFFMGAKIVPLVKELEK